MTTTQYRSSRAASPAPTGQPLAACHRDREPVEPDGLVLVFDRPDDERAVVSHLSGTYGPGHECATPRRRLHTWRAGRRELALCADQDRLTLSVQRAC